jgi:hypothetical protein
VLLFVLIPPSAVPENFTGSPTPSKLVLLQVIKLVPVAVAVQFTDASNNQLYNTLETHVNGAFGTLSVNFLLTTLSAGSTTVKVRASVSAGAGTIYASSGNTYSYAIHDLGPI